VEEAVISRHGVSIRLTDERWTHIVEQHGEMADMRADVLETVREPDRVLAGKAGELLAVKSISSGKWLIAVYREFEDDGFIITAFFTRRTNMLNKREQLWP